MSTFKMFVGINYFGTDKGTNLEFNPQSEFDAAKILGDLLLDEKDAINFMITVVREDNEKGE